jgi:hypothetical protein
VINVYRELEEAGLIETRGSAGSFVTAALAMTAGCPNPLGARASGDRYGRR